MQKEARVVRKVHYQVKGDSRPQPVKKSFDFAISEFEGMLCPICEKTRLSASNQYPICHACQEKYIGKDIEGFRILEELRGYHFVLDQEVNWRKKSLILAGKINGKDWQARFLGEQGWLVQRNGDSEKDKITEDESKIISNTLMSLTPRFKERILESRTHLCKRVLIVALGGVVLTCGTIGLILAKKKKTEKEEQ